MNLIISSVFFFALASAALASVLERTPGDYLELCRKAPSADSFRSDLMLEEGWVKVRLDPNASDYDWHENGDWTAEKLMLASNFTLNAVRLQTPKRNVPEALELFRAEEVFTRNFFPLFSDPDRLELYFNASVPRIIGFHGRPDGQIIKCVFSQLSKAGWEKLFEKFEPVSRQYGTDFSWSGMLWIKPELNAQPIQGALLYASKDYLKEFIGITKGDLLAYTIWRVGR